MRHLNSAQFGWERGAWLSALSQRFTAPLARIGAALLALLLFIAPTWHICALGGNAACHDHTTQSASSGHSRVKSKVLICGLPQTQHQETIACAPRSQFEDEVCQCPDHKTSVASLSPVHPQHFDENCLARLLWNFPAALILFFIFFILWLRRIICEASTHIAPLTAFVPTFEARGPPVCSPF